MGFTVNTNISAMNAHKNASSNNIGLDKSLSSLSSGLRINKAADDAAGMAITSQLTAQSKGLGQAIRNANDGIGLLQTADGALEEYTNILKRVRVLSVQSSNDTQDAQSRSYIQKEVDALLEEADDIATSTKFNGKVLFDAGGAVEATPNTLTTAEIDTGNAIRQYGIFAINTLSSPPPLPSPQTVDASITDFQNRFSYDPGGISNSINFSATMINFPATDINVLQSFYDDMLAQALLIQGASGSFANMQVAVTSVFDGFKDTYPITNATTASANKSFTFHIGAYADQTQSVDISSMRTADVVGTIDVTSQSAAETSIQTIDTALKNISDQRSLLGSAQNKLESTVRNISVTQVNIENARSQIQDVDFASESANFAKHNIISQSGSYALSQANARQNDVMRLFF